MTKAYQYQNLLSLDSFFLKNLKEILKIVKKKTTKKTKLIIQFKMFHNCKLMPTAYLKKKCDLSLCNAIFYFRQTRIFMKVTLHNISHLYFNKANACKAP